MASMLARFMSIWGGFTSRRQMGLQPLTSSGTKIAHRLHSVCQAQWRGEGLLGAKVMGLETLRPSTRETWNTWGISIESRRFPPWWSPCKWWTLRVDKQNSWLNVLVVQRLDQQVQLENKHFGTFDTGTWSVSSLTQKAVCGLKTFFVWFGILAICLVTGLEPTLIVKDVISNPRKSLSFRSSKWCE